MKPLLLVIAAVILLNAGLSAQKNDLVTVKAGSKILDHFPFRERYRYPEFTPGKVYFRNNTYSAFKLNYNLLMAEMEFIQSRDTLAIVNKKDIKYIVIDKDTFYFDKNYLELISHPVPLKVVLNQYIKLKEIVKKDSYGTSSSGSSTQSYGSLPSNGQFYKLAANEDMVFQKIREYYLSTPSSGFVPFKKKNVMQLFPKNEDDIKKYLKSNEIDFDSREDLIKFAAYLQGLKT